MAGARLILSGPAPTHWLGFDDLVIFEGRESDEEGQPIVPSRVAPEGFSNGKSLWQGLQMRNALALICAAALAVTALAFPGPSQAHERWPDIPDEVGVRVPIDGWIPYRCNDRPVYNFYHGAYYGGRPPAVFLDYAYRPYYRYTANRVIPRTYFCSERWR